MPQTQLEIRRVPLDSLHLDPANAREHPAENIDAIVASLKRFNQAEPLVVHKPTGRIIGGNGRFVAMKRLGWTECDVVELDIDDLQATALGIALNRTADLAGWNEESLVKLLQELQAEDALDGVGYSEADIDKLLADLQAETDSQLEIQEDDIPEPPEAAVSRPGDLWILGNHRLLCGDSSKPDDVDRLLAGAPIHLVNTDPPYNVRVEPRSNNAIAAGNSSFKQTHHQKLDLKRFPGKSKPTTTRMRAKDRPLANDFMSDGDYDKLLRAWFGNIARVLLPGRCFYIWGGYANCGNYPPVLKETALYFSQAIIWVKEHPVLTRKDFMGNHEWCQPAGTRILTPDGEVPIESLRDGDQVVSFSRRSSAMVGFKRGFEIRRTCRDYQGKLFGVAAGGQTTWCTEGHPWTVKLLPEAGWAWCVYLMRRGDWWRVGKCRLITSWGFGLKHRLCAEGADEAWILSTHRTNFDALAAEQVIVSLYGIPSIYWDPTPSRTEEMISRLYDRLDLAQLRQSAVRAISDHNRSPEFPFVVKGKTRDKLGRRIPLTVRACNLLPDFMAVPRPIGRLQPNFEWTTIQNVETQPHKGPVYSMEVSKHHHYIADGLVTHNCFYGWREGAGHKFFGPNNAVDVWSVKKINPQSMVHLTEKPVELAARAIRYSSQLNENILDLFGGSGSTMIACEQLNRKAFLMEIDPLYSDVIITRWEKFTGKKAVLDGGGTYSTVSEERLAAGRAS